MLYQVEHKVNFNRIWLGLLSMHFFIEHRIGRCAPDLRINTWKYVSSGKIVSQKYPLRDVPDHRVFMNLHHNLCDYESLRNNRHSKDEPRATRTLTMQQNLLDSFRRNPSNSVRAVATSIRRSLNSVHRVLQVKVYTRTIFKKYSLSSSQMIFHVCVLHCGILTNVAKTYCLFRKLQGPGFNVLSPNSVLRFKTFPILRFIYG